MTELDVVIPFAEHVRLLTNSGLYENLKAEQLPELQMAIVATIVLTCFCIGLLWLLWHCDKENRELHGVINEDHIEDTVTEKDVDLKVEHQAHGRVEC